MLCLPICNALEEFTGVHATASEQHRDLRASSAKRSVQDCETFIQWLQVQSLLSYSGCDTLVSISTDLVADKTINCDEADFIGLKAAAKMDDKPYTEIKLSSKDKVITISSAKDTVKVRGRDAVIKPTLLFMRITCDMQDSSEMDNYLCYELAQQPPSLFEIRAMCKTDKSGLGTMFKSKATNLQVTQPNA